MQGHPHFVKGGVLWVGLFNRLYRGLTLQRRERDRTTLPQRRGTKVQTRDPPEPLTRY